MYHFLSGYTAKVAGTERGLGKEPQATSAPASAGRSCRARRRSTRRCLGEKLREHGVTCWLVNTGWVGGPFGVGERMKLRYTRAMLNAAIDGELKVAAYVDHPVFGVSVPKSCPGVPATPGCARDVGRQGGLRPRGARPGARFKKNFRRFGDVAPEIAAAAPHA